MLNICEDSNPPIMGSRVVVFLLCCGFRLCLEVLLDVRRTLLKRGFTDIQYINLGGGLAIDYEKHVSTFVHRYCLTDVE